MVSGYLRGFVGKLKVSGIKEICWDVELDYGEKDLSWGSRVRKIMMGSIGTWIWQKWEYRGEEREIYYGYRFYLLL